MKPVIKIDIVSDIVCPWCYIGKRRLEKAVTQLSGQYDFNITYHPFELNPELPEGGQNQKEYLAKRFGGETKYHQITGHVNGVAAGEGLHFDFHKQHIMPNTRKAHSIIMAAKEEGNQIVVAERFFKAYFTDGIDLTNTENLISLAIDSGLQKHRVEDILKDSAAAEQVAVAEDEARKLGIHGVPFFIINDRYGISGAQSTNTFVSALTEIGSKIEIEEATSCSTDAPC